MRMHHHSRLHLVWKVKRSLADSHSRQNDDHNDGNHNQHDHGHQTPVSVNLSSEVPHIFLGSLERRLSVLHGVVDTVQLFDLFVEFQLHLHTNLVHLINVLLNTIEGVHPLLLSFLAQLDEFFSIASVGVYHQSFIGSCRLCPLE
jgi:hypothetical protein